MININHLEKVAGPTGQAFARVFKETGKFITKHPGPILAGIGTLGAIGFIADRANKLRGLHQIISDAHRDTIMDRQTYLLSQIARNKNETPKEARRPSQEPMPIIPPLR